MRQSSLAKVGGIDAVSISIDREIASRYDNVKIVADNIDDVVAVASAAATTATVAASIGAVTAVGSNIDAVVDVHNNTANIATMIDNFTNMNTVASNIADVSDVASGMADILTASSNIADITVAADNIAHINQVAAGTAQINEIVATVIPNMAEILLADDRAATATSMAVTATTQAGLANTARVAAEVAQGIAETKATEAGLSAAAADVSADLAAASEAVATTKANAASASADAAHVSELAAAAILDTFDDRYLGAFASNPIVDNDGNALLNGAIYFNTSTHSLRVYDAGLVDWIALPSVTFAGLQDVSLTSVATGDVLKWNGTDWVNTKTVGLNSLQLLGGTGTQGTVTWNTDEETLDVIQNGATLQLGQETQIHVRNNSGSSIADGKVVMATGALGASGRITAGLYDGTADVKYVLGVATETIADGDDGKVTSFGKIIGINTSAWNEGDVLYAATAGGLTNVAPVTGVKLAVAFVTTKHAVNGRIMVRVNGVDELRYEPKNTNIQTHIVSTSNPHGVTKTQVGLSNVDNTSDVTKNVLSATKLTTPRAIALTGDVTGTADFDGSAGVSIATTVANDSHLHSFANLTSKPTTLSGYGITDAINVSQKGVANGVATLDASGLVPVGQLPSYVDDVLEYTNLGMFPAVGEPGKIYVALDTNKTYRWSGTAYIYITSGAVDSVAGKTGVVSLVKADVGLSNVDNTSDLLKPISTATAAALALKAPLASPALTGTPTAPTAAVGTSTTQLATTAFVKAEIANDSTAVHKTGDETIAGVKTFSSSIVGNITGNANNATTATTANALNTANAYVGTGFTANGGALRAQNWGSVATNGVTYYGNANSYIFKQGDTWYFNNEQGSHNTLSTAGAIVTANGGNWNISISGTARYANDLAGDQTNWANYRTNAVANMLSWKSHGNGHCIFDASAGTAPNGVSVNNINAQGPWIQTFPTLMGWNGSNTYGVRVDSARVADYASNAVGYNQTWQDVTASRASGVTYTNSTGKPIFLAVFSTNGNFSGVLNINGIGIYYGIGSGSYFAMQSIQIIVPHGNTYNVTFTDTGVAHKWLELR